MDFEKITDIWNAQEQPPVVTKETDLLNRLRKDHRQLERRLLWVNFQEVPLCVLLFLFFGGVGLVDSTSRWSCWVAAVLCLEVGVFLVVSTIRQKRKEAVFGNSVKDQLNRALSQARHREWLYRNNLWWYVSPIAIGVAAIFYQKMLADGSLLAGAICGVVVAVLYFFIYRMNRRIARREYRPRVQRLEAMLRHLDSTDVDEMDGLGGAHALHRAPLPPTKATLVDGSDMTKFIAGLIVGLIAGSIAGSIAGFFVGGVGAAYVFVTMTPQQKAPVELEFPDKPIKSAEELASFLEKHPYEVGYFAKNLATGKTTDRFGERPVCLASIVKIFCLTELYRQVHQNDLDLMQEITVPKRGPVTLQEAADLMIGQSDNAATDALADFLGHDNINRIPALLGIDSLSAEILPEDGVLQNVLDKRIFGKRIAKEGLPQHGTAKGIAEYFELLINRQVITEEVSDQIIEFFTRHPKPFSIHYAKEYTFAGKGGNILWTRPPKHYSMTGWGLFVQDKSGEYTVLCVWGEWFPENMPPPMQSEFLKYVTDCVISATGS